MNGLPDILVALGCFMMGLAGMTTALEIYRWRVEKREREQ